MTTTATPTLPPAHLITKFDPKTYQVIPVDKDQVVDDFEMYTLCNHLVANHIPFFDIPGTFVFEGFNLLHDLRAAYHYAEANGWSDYGPTLPMYEQYVKFVRSLNTGLASKQIRLRRRDNRPEAPAPTSTIAALPALTPGSATLDDVIATVNATAVNVNALVVLMAANQQTRSRQPGRVKRIGSWLTKERQPGAHS